MVLPTQYLPLLCVVPSSCCSSPSGLLDVPQTPNSFLASSSQHKAFQHRDQNGYRQNSLLWLMVSERSVHSHLAPPSWTETHGSGSLWWVLLFTSRQTGIKEEVLEFVKSSLLPFVIFRGLPVRGMATPTFRMDVHPVNSQWKHRYGHS